MVLLDLIEYFSFSGLNFKNAGILILLYSTPSNCSICCCWVCSYLSSCSRLGLLGKLFPVITHGVDILGRSLGDSNGNCEDRDTFTLSQFSPVWLITFAKYFTVMVFSPAFSTIKS